MKSDRFMGFLDGGESHGREAVSCAAPLSSRLLRERPMLRLWLQGMQTAFLWPDRPVRWSGVSVAHRAGFGKDAGAVHSLLCAPDTPAVAR